MIEVQVRYDQGDFALDAAFASDRHVVALFGPSGSGKTTLLNAIAGLIRPQAARIVIGGTVLTDTEARVFLAPHRRRVGYVFQDARLFPHLNVGRNLAYGRWFAPPRERNQTFDEVVALLGIEPLLERRPRNLSGGEKQRVAIGRALLASPRLLLMDEPLASLDEARKRETLPYLERLRDQLAIPIVYVSHSRPEVERLAGRIVEMEGGRVVREPSPF